MIIGLISDTHDKAGPFLSAVNILKERKVDAIAHCGDFETKQCPEQLEHLDIPVYAVAGNTDARYVDDLIASARAAGVNMEREKNVIPLSNGLFLAMTHEHDRKMLGDLIADARYPYVCHGHTHRLRDEMIGNTRVICPGGLGSYTGSTPTIAILDTETDNLEIININ